MAGLQFKLEGNRMFAQKRYEEAIKLYTKAISKSPNNAVFFTNRALCHIKLNRWQKAIDDCKIGLEHDPQSVKAFFFLGHSYGELHNYDEAIIQLHKAYSLAKQQKLNFGDDIAVMLRITKKKRWEKLEKERIAKETELEEYLNALMIEDKEKQLENIEGSDEEQKENVNQKFTERWRELQSIFAQVDERRKMREVPDYLCGKISFEIMKDPVITPSGITYDRKDIEEHLQRVGHFDPVTRQELTASDLIPNLAISEVIDNFIEENGWAIDY